MTKPRDPAPYVDAAREMAAGETVLYAPMTFNLGRVDCPHCGGEIRVEVSAVEKEAGTVVPMRPIEETHTKPA